MSSEPSRRPPELAGAYLRCRRIHAHHGRTYYLATRLLPRERRPHVWALYAFARVADELVDNPGAGGPETLLAWGNSAMVSLRAASPPDPGLEPVLAATWHTVRAYDLDLHLLEEFLGSMAMDLTVTRYPTFSDLRGYMRGSAAVIGELMAPVLGAVGADALHRAGTLGEAFQLTNFIRDVAEDHRRGRVYLPLEDLARHGVSEEMLATAVRTGNPPRPVRSLLAREVWRALDLYAEAAPGLELVDPHSRPCLEAAFTLYRRILFRVIASDYNVFAARATVPGWERAFTAAQAVAGSAALRLGPEGRPWRGFARRQPRRCTS